MTRRSRTPGDDLGRLDRELRDLTHDLRGDPAPDLLPGVAERIAREPGQRRPPIDWRRPWTRALSALLVLLAVSTGVLAGSASAREGIAGLLNIRGISVKHAAPGARPAPRSTAVELFLGEKVSFATAQREASFHIQQPELPGFGDASAVYVLRSAGAGPVVSLTYRPKHGLPLAPETGTGMLLTQFAGTIDADVFKKVLFTLSRTQQVSVNGHQGIWIEGPQELITFTSSGNGVGFPPRLADNSLIWESGGVTLRMETVLRLDQALAIAESIR